LADALKGREQFEVDESFQLSIAQIETGATESLKLKKKDPECGTETLLITRAVFANNG